MKTDGSAFQEKSSLKMLQVTFSSKLDDWGTYIISIAKTASKKIVLIHSMKFLFLEVVLYLFFKKIWDSLHARLNRDGIPRKRSTKRLEHTGNIFGKNLHLIGVC